MFTKDKYVVAKAWKKEIIYLSTLYVYVYSHYFKWVMDITDVPLKKKPVVLLLQGFRNARFNFLKFTFGIWIYLAICNVKI
jgi:hypothetical protein